MKLTHQTLSILALVALMHNIAPIDVFAEEEEGERESEFGEIERTEERENEREGGEGFGSSSMILYVTIAAIMAAIVYTVFKIASAKKKTTKQS